MFVHRTELRVGDGQVEVAFTDASTDLTVPADLARVAADLGVDELRVMHQVHGRTVVGLDEALPLGSTPDDAGLPDADAIVIDRPGAATARAADCVPVALVDLEAPRAAVVHSGRVGLVAGVVPAAVEALRRGGSATLRAYVGPRACGQCYEVPQQMTDDVAAVAPAARSTTSWGTPALDVGAGVIEQLQAAGVEVVDLGGCTIEDESLHSYRRQGDESGRQGVVVVVR